MIELVRHSIVLFFSGKLFADPAKAYTQLAFGIVTACLVLIVSVKLIALPVWAGAIIAGFVGGVLQPYLFRNLRYR